MRKKSRVTMIVVSVAVGVLLFFVAILIHSVAVPKQYTTNNIADYGKFTGNYDNRSVQVFITSFFPAEIETHFSDVTYSYRAQKNDTYAFEAYLSLTIKDKSKYNAFVEEHTEGLEQCTFRYDAAYQEYTIEDEFLPIDPESKEKGIHISFAKIGKILCSQEKQEIIFVALGVYDGGVVQTDFLNVYFDRFNIDPLEYALHTTPEYTTKEQ